jgi:PAS domain S-box-containing protein
LTTTPAQSVAHALSEAPDHTARPDELCHGNKALTHVLASLPHMLLVLDDDLNVLFTNRGMEGYSAEQLQGMHITKLLTAEVHERALAAMRRTLATGQPEQYGGHVLDAEGRTRHYDVRVCGIHRDGKVIGLTLHAGEIGQTKHEMGEPTYLERGVLQALSHEQYRIGNDLHDGLGQELTGIALMLRGLAGRLTSEYPPLLPEVEGITRLVNNAIESTRSLARGLSPVNLERGGLQDALDGMALNASELYGVNVVFTHRQSSQQPLNAELANHLYRIAQEAVRNAVRHGKARSIRLHLSSARAKVKLSITDDGVGMPPDAMDAAGMGLKIMCYRARILGGDVSFESVEPSGTRVICECPLEAGGAAHIRKLPKRKARA